jgi:hypothetical protein
MFAIKAHYNDGVVAFDDYPPMMESNVIVTFLDGDTDPVDEIAASRLALPTAHYSDTAVRGSKANRSVTIDNEDGWE